MYPRLLHQVKSSTIFVKNFILPPKITLMQTPTFSMLIKKQENDLVNLTHPPLPPLSVPATLNPPLCLKHVPIPTAATRDTTSLDILLKGAGVKATIAMTGEGHGTSTFPSYSTPKRTMSPHTLILLFQESLPLVQLKLPMQLCKPILPPNTTTNPPPLLCKMTPLFPVLSIPP